MELKLKNRERFDKHAQNKSVIAEQEKQLYNQRLKKQKEFRDKADKAKMEEDAERGH